jgi:hypothetical protein
MNSLLSPGARVAWSSSWPRRSFAGTVVSVGKRTAHVKLHGRRKLGFVKIERLRNDER